MNKFSVNIKKYFSHLDDEKKQSFKDYFLEYVRNYAPEYDESNHLSDEEIKLSEVWRYMDGNFEFVSASDKLSLEELACNMADEVKDRVLAIS